MGGINALTLSPKAKKWLFLLPQIGVGWGSQGRAMMSGFEITRMPLICWATLETLGLQHPGGEGGWGQG